MLDYLAGRMGLSREEAIQLADEPFETYSRTSASEDWFQPSSVADLNTFSNTSSGDSSYNTLQYGYSAPHQSTSTSTYGTAPPVSAYPYQHSLQAATASAAYTFPYSSLTVSSQTIEQAYAYAQQQQLAYSDPWVRVPFPGRSNLTNL